MAPTPPDQYATQIDSHQIYIVAFTILGVFLLVETLPPLSYQLVNLWATRKVDFGREQSVQRRLAFVAPVLKLILALILVFWGKGLAFTIARLREIINERIESRKIANDA